MKSDKENFTIDLAFVLFRVLTIHLGPALWNFMISKLLQDSKSMIIDVYKLLKEMISQRISDYNFFSTSDPSDLSHLDTALKGRNAVLHGYFDLISLDWETYLVSWIQVLRMINAVKAAAAVQTIYDDLRSSKRTPLDVSISSFSAPAFVSGKFLSPKPDQMTREEYVKVIKKNMELYRCMTKVLGPALRDYYLQKHNQTKVDSEIDAQNLLFDLLDDWKLMIHHPDHTVNVQDLETAREGRNKLSHSDLMAILHNWESYILSWVKVCSIISNNTAANEIQAVYDRIKTETCYTKRRIVLTTVKLIKPGRVSKRYVKIRRISYLNAKQPVFCDDLFVHQHHP